MKLELIWKKSSFSLSQVPFFLPGAAGDAGKPSDTSGAQQTCDARTISDSWTSDNHRLII